VSAFCPHCHAKIELSVVPDGAPPRSVMYQCADAAGRHMCVPTSTVIDGDRSPRVAKARHLAMWCMRQLGRSFPDIAAVFGRDHSTVQYACRNVERKWKGEGLQVLERVRGIR